MSKTGNELAAFVKLNAEAAAKLGIYENQLLKWNKKMNLCGAASREELRFLFLDSFIAAKALDKLFPSVNSDFLMCDLGAGAGLPGIPLRIVWDRGQFIMVEAREKRALFLSSILAKLNLAATSVFHGRAEKFFTELERPLNCIISRAFMPWEKLLPFCRPWMNKDSILMIMANSPLPVLSDGWNSRGEFPYLANNMPRWLWALAPTSHEC